MACILLTLNTLGYSLGPAIADRHRPYWARPDLDRGADRDAAAVARGRAGGGGLCHLFFATAFSMRLFGGSLTDPNGVPPIATKVIAGRQVVFDTNVVVFCVQIVILLLALFLIS